MPTDAPPLDAALDECMLDHKTAFYDLLTQIEIEKGQNSSLFTNDRYAKMFEVCAADRDGISTNDFKKLHKKEGFNQAYTWRKKYCVMKFGDTYAVVFREISDKDGNQPALDTFKRVAYYETLFDNIAEVHFSSNDHPKARTLSQRIRVKFGSSIPEWVQRAFTDTCPRCVEKRCRLKPTAGFQPILTRGFGRRGQVDLIDMQSMPDGDFRFLLNYQDHGIKLTWSEPIIAKRASCIAMALIRIFSMLGPPAILQSDNGSEFSGIAAGKMVPSEISDSVSTC
jgi:hypothetical protein